MTVEDLNVLETYLNDISMVALNKGNTSEYMDIAIDLDAVRNNIYNYHDCGEFLDSVAMVELFEKYGVFVSE